MRASKSQVSILKCKDYRLDDVYEVVKKSLDNLGGLGRFVKPGQRVLLNPNLLAAKGPERAITTHPMIVIAVARQLQELGCEVFIGDSPGGATQGVNRVWNNTQMSDAAAAVGATLVNFETSGVYEKWANGNLYRLSKPLFDFDLVISLPKLKTHVLTLMTGAIKNNFGAVPGVRKAEYHKKFPKADDFSAMLVDIFSVVKPTLYLMDAILSMEGDGPSSGKPKTLGLLLASTDGVAMDAVAASIMGFKPGQIPTTKIASERGLGTDDLSRIEIIGERLSEAKAKDFKTPSNKFWKLTPRFMIRLIEPYFWVRPAINEGLCTNCNTCVENCPMNTISADSKIPTFDYKKCINCLCCHELCPEGAVFLERSWLARRIGS
ncbi:MAG: hypothetical protein AMJ41_03885 [candidate division Zixibacteria bacterium DG_27]|nr:MAG: hypothetical protein AMJ41_03885 [candidate division Zixibacteria bacterium DG_27]